MKRTLKRESKVFEIVESDAFVVSGSFFLPCFQLLSWVCQCSILFCRIVVLTFGWVKLKMAGWRQLQGSVLSMKNTYCVFQCGIRISVAEREKFFFGTHCWFQHLIKKCLKYFFINMFLLFLVTVNSKKKIFFVNLFFLKNTIVWGDATVVWNWFHFEINLKWLVALFTFMQWWVLKKKSL